MIPFNYHHLYYFYVIAREGSISKACAKLYLAQPTLSTQLRQFEKSIGRTLFERTKQRLSLTDDGRLVLDYAESIFELGTEMQDTLNDRKKIGRLSIQVGVLNGTPRSFAHALLERVLAHAPTAHVELREADLDGLLRDLREHRLDVVLTDVIVRGHDREELSNHLIGQMPIVFAASPALARKYPRVPHDLDGAPLILPSLPSQVYHQILDLMATWKVKPNIVAEVQDIELARRLALSGRGIAPLNAYTVSVSQPKNGLLVLKSALNPAIYESVYLVTRRRKVTNPLTDYLINNLKLSSKGLLRPSVLQSPEKK